MALSHRDQRAHRSVRRAFLLFGAAVVALTVLVLYAPQAGIGFLGVLALGGAGLGLLGWSEQLLEGYAADLRSFRESTPLEGFVRAELASRLDLDRPVSGPGGRSPHTRRRGPEGDDPDRSRGPD